VRRHTPRAFSRAISRDAINVEEIRVSRVAKIFPAHSIVDEEWSANTPACGTKSVRPELFTLPKFFSQGGAIKRLFSRQNALTRPNRGVVIRKQPPHAIAFAGVGATILLPRAPRGGCHNAARIIAVE
jgi:hypothetical protein